MANSLVRRGVRAANRFKPSSKSAVSPRAVAIAATASVSGQIIHPVNAGFSSAERVVADSRE